MCDFQINGMLITKLRVVDLKEELEARGLSKSGKKDELIARLVSYLEVRILCEEINYTVLSKCQFNFQTIQSPVSSDEHRDFL